MIAIDPAVQVALITSAVTFSLGAGGGILKLVKESRETLHQVKNDHGTNLRDDVDKVIASVEKIETKLSTIHQMVVVNSQRANTMDERDSKLEDMLAVLIREKMEP